MSYMVTHSGHRRREGKCCSYNRLADQYRGEYLSEYSRVLVSDNDQHQEMHRREISRRTQMTLPEYKLWDTALRHQRRDQSIQPQLTTLDFHLILHVDMFAARPHTLGRSNTNPVLRGWDGTGQVFKPRIRPNHLHTGWEAGSSQGCGAAPEGTVPQPSPDTG